MLREEGLDPRQVLAQPVVLAQRVLEIVRCFGEHADDFGLVEPSENGAEPLLPEIERGDTHQALGRG